MSHAPDGSPLRVLFVCTHNSARSIMAEALLRSRGGDRYDVESAGTEASVVRPLTLQVLREAGVPTEGLRSTSVARVLGQPFDYVITVCDSARQTCPTFPGEGERLHWSIDDPAAAQGNDAQRLEAFQLAFKAVATRIDEFIRDRRP